MKPTPLERSLNQLSSANVDWLICDEDGELPHSEVQMQEAAFLSQKGKEEDPWCIEEMLNALETFSVSDMRFN